MALYRLRALGVVPGEQFNFSIHATGTLSTGDAAAAWGNSLQAAWGAGWSANYDAATVINTASAALLDQLTGRQSARADVTVDLAGTDATGVRLPPQVAIVVSIRTDLANRSGRGRFYLPAPTTTALAAGVMASAAQTAFNAATLELWSTLRAAGLQPVIYHRPGSPLVGTTTNATRYEIDTIFDTQRRRRDKLIGVTVGGTI